MIVFDLSVKKHDMQTLSDMLVYAPKVVLGGVKSGFAQIRKSWVGTNKKNEFGTFQNKFLRRKQRHRGGDWGKSAKAAFKGFMNVKVRGIGDLQLWVGTNEKVKSPMLRDWRRAEDGDYKVSSSKMMMMPVYKNLRNIGVHGNAKQERLNNRSDYFLRRWGNKYLLVNKDEMERERAMKGPNADLGKAIMFVGAQSRISKSQKFKFESRFNSQYTGTYHKMLQRKLDMAITKYERRKRDGVT